MYLIALKNLLEMEILDRSKLCVSRNTHTSFLTCSVFLIISLIFFNCQDHKKPEKNLDLKWFNNGKTSYYQVDSTNPDKINHYVDIKRNGDYKYFKSLMISKEDYLDLKNNESRGFIYFEEINDTLAVFILRKSLDGYRNLIDFTSLRSTQGNPNNSNLSFAKDTLILKDLSHDRYYIHYTAEQFSIKCLDVERYTFNSSSIESNNCLNPLRLNTTLPIAYLYQEDKLVEIPVLKGSMLEGGSYGEDEKYLFSMGLNYFSREKIFEWDGIRHMHNVHTLYYGTVDDFLNKRFIED